MWIMSQYLEDFTTERFYNLLEKLGLVKIILHGCIIAGVVLCSVWPQSMLASKRFLYLIQINF